MATKKRITWTGPALQDLLEMREYVRRTNPSAARKLAALIRRRVLSLRDHPRSGRVVPELAERGCRELVVAPYRIVYMVEKGRVSILRVWHGRRDLSQERE